MTISEKYQKSILGDKLYNTVILADIIELNGEKYFILSGYLFNYIEVKQNSYLDEKYIKNTFFKRDINDEKSDIDAYYLIYNIEKDQFINNKSEFIKEHNLYKNIRLDRTKCEEIEIGGQLAHIVNTNKKEYYFFELSDETSQYFILHNTKHSLYPEHIIEFNMEYNKVIIDNNIIELREMYDEFEQKNISQILKNISRVMRKIPTENNEVEDNEENE